MGMGKLLCCSRIPGKLKEAIVKQLCEVSGQRLILLRQGVKAQGDAEIPSDFVEKAIGWMMLVKPMDVSWRRYVENV